ncbi:MAG: L-threonylcarbamoyladenylate synthase [Cyanobacteria bacterium J06641_5]
MQICLATLIAAARAGEVVGFPTDTVPGLGVRPDRAAELYALKGRTPAKPLILLGADAEQLWPYVTGSASDRALWQQLATRHWPGALTLVLPASEQVPAAVHPRDTSTIGLRVPNSAIARDILRQAGPLATSSANRSGQPTLLSLAAIAAEFPTVPVLAAPVQDETKSQQDSAESSTVPSTPSTVVKWTGASWEVLRQGAVTIDC